MSFNPLGAFDVNAPISPELVTKGKALVASLPTVPPDSLKRGYFHWTVGPYAMCFGDYNLEARYVNGEWILTITHDPRDNAPGLTANAMASHTYMRNTRAIGVAITGMENASVHDFGKEPVTIAGLQALCMAMAAATAKYEIDVCGISEGSAFAGEPNLLTHAEAADRGGNPLQYDPYGPLHTCERWDLYSFVALPEGVELSDVNPNACGDALRKFTHRCKLALTELK